ncbi:MAG: hypothetical protein K9H25_04740 [Rhodospirillum sp.]|nr:hypothetical protein [Rhodospirillum sp.]MCF8490444.1 hypothetical protein [Rhodospirillum sp.]MCF8500457.1 hypothetical protein [Rhodospirillum sp.]
MDILTRLDGAIPLAQRHITAPKISLRYVPDRRVLDPESVAVYLSHLAREIWAGPEELALAILDDINNEAVPRWIQVRVTAHAPGGLDHRVVVEDHQPQWRPSWSGAPVGDTGAP